MEFPNFNRKYIFKGSIFHCYVSLPEGNNKRLLSCFCPKKYPWLQHVQPCWPCFAQKLWGLLPRKWTNSSPKTDHCQSCFIFQPYMLIDCLRDMLKKFFHLPTIHLGDMLVGGEYHNFSPRLFRYTGLCLPGTWRESPSVSRETEVSDERQGSLHYQPKQSTIKWKYLKFTMHSHCLIPQNG